MRAALAIVAAMLVLAGCGGADADRGDDPAREGRYAQAKQDGLDMSSGPCLGVIKPAGSPTSPTIRARMSTTRPRTSARRTRSGEADHFVELTPEGEFIRSG